MALRDGANLPPAQAPPAPAVTVPAPQALVVPEAVPPPVSSFVPPVSANLAADVLSSLFSCFPIVKAAVITAIITHKFYATDLYKLNPQYRNRSERRVLALNGDTLELHSGDTTTKEYHSLTFILGTAIASHSAQDLGIIHRNFTAYIVLLHQFAAEYN